MNIPEFATKKELYNYLIENKELLISEKKANKIETKGIIVNNQLTSKTFADKKLKPDTDKVLYRTICGNTTYIRDSHKDVHIDGIWTKTLKENNSIHLKNQHRPGLENILQYYIKPYTKMLQWRDLGYNHDGITQALLCDIEIEDSDIMPKYIFQGYKKNIINQHSVGMYYVKLKLAINDADYKEEFAEYQKHIEKIVNKDEVNEDGYFFAVYEAKLVEISPVEAGSNFITPVFDNNSEKNKTLEIFELNAFKQTLKEIFEPETLKNNKPLLVNVSDLKAIINEIFV